MTKEEISNSIEEINEQINKLTLQKINLEKQLLDLSDTFLEKFKVWYNNSSKCEYSYLPNSEIINDLVRSRDYRRGETIDIERLIGEEDFYFLVNSKEEVMEDCSYNENEYNKEYRFVLDKYLEVLKEAFKLKIKTFKVDW